MNVLKTFHFEREFMIIKLRGQSRIGCCCFLCFSYFLHILTQSHYVCVSLAKLFSISIKGIIYEGKKIFIYLWAARCPVVVSHCGCCMSREINKFIFFTNAEAISCMMAGGKKKEKNIHNDLFLSRWTNEKKFFMVSFVSVHCINFFPLSFHLQPFTYISVYPT